MAVLVNSRSKHYHKMAICVKGITSTQEIWLAILW